MSGLEGNSSEDLLGYIKKYEQGLEVQRASDKEIEELRVRNLELEEELGLMKDS